MTNSKLAHLANQAKKKKKKGRPKPKPGGVY